MTANSRSDDEGENSENPKDDGDGKSAEDLSQAVLETMIAEGDKSVDRNCAGEHTGESGGPEGNAEAVSPHVGSVLQVGQSESKGNAEAVSPRRSGSQENPSVGSVGSGSEFLFGGSERNTSGNDRFQPDFVVKDGVADINIPEEILEDAEPLWKCFVVGYFMNDAPHIGSIHATVNRIWSSQGKSPKIDVQFIDKNTVLFRIEDAQVRSRILRRKYWHIAEVPLVLNEWSPESARAPPDLSAMPLWVDFVNLPGYLYSKKGICFLSRTTGKFVKLHPNTEKCIRLDVARALVEVDLQKPLPRKICFKDRDGSRVEVAVNYPWLPPRCDLCSKWGHLAKECKESMSVVILKCPQEDEHLAPKVDKVVQEVACSGKAVVSKLLNEQESLKSAQQAHVIEESGVRRDSAVESGNVIDARAGENWYLVSGQNQKRSSPTKQKNVEVAKGISRSPNGFLALQDIREEGEIEDDAEEDYVQGIEEDPSKLAEGGNSRDVLLLRGSISSQRGKAKGSRRPIVNSRDLRASVVTNQSRKSSLRKK